MTNQDLIAYILSLTDEQVDRLIAHLPVIALSLEEPDRIDPPRPSEQAE